MKVLDWEESADIEDAAIEAGDYGEEDTLRRDYSGRGMMGEECFAIVGDDATLARFSGYLATVQPELAAELSRRVRSDSLGLRAVYYWPGYQLAGEGDA